MLHSRKCINSIINLRDYYPFYTSDCFMEVSEEVAEMFKEFERKEAAYRLRTYRHKAYYSLDRDDGLEHEAVFVALSPHELYERKVTMQELHAAIASLPDKQAKRIYAHCIRGMTKQDALCPGNVLFGHAENEMSINPFCLFVRQIGNRCVKFLHGHFPLIQFMGRMIRGWLVAGIFRMFHCIFQHFTVQHIYIQMMCSFGETAMS